MIFTKYRFLIFGFGLATAARLLAQDELPPMVINDLSISNSGESIAIASSPPRNAGQRGVLVTHNLKTSESKVLRDGPLRFRAISFSPDDRQLAVGGDLAEILILDLANGEVAHRLTGHTASVRKVRFTPDGQHLVSAGEDKTVKKWMVSFEEQIQSTTVEHAAITDIDVSSDGSIIATADRENYAYSLQLWDGSSGDIQYAQTFGSHIPKIEFQPHTLRLGIASYGSELIVFDTENREEAYRFFGLGSGFQGVSFSQDGRWLAGAKGDDGVWVFNIDPAAVSSTQLAALIKKLDHDDYRQRELAMRELADLGMGARESLLQSTKSDVAEVRWRARKLLKRLYELDPQITDNKTRVRLTGHPGSVQIVRFSPDSKWLCAGDDQGVVQIWEVGTWRRVAEVNVNDLVASKIQK